MVTRKLFSAYSALKVAHEE